MDKLPLDFSSGNGESPLANLAEGEEIPEEATADDIRLPVRENRALKVQIRKMQAEMPLLNSLQRRIRVLEERLAKK